MVSKLRALRKNSLESKPQLKKKEISSSKERLKKQEHSQHLDSQPNPTLTPVAKQWTPLIVRTLKSLKANSKVPTQSSPLKKRQTSSSLNKWTLSRRIWESSEMNLPALWKRPFLPSLRKWPWLLLPKLRKWSLLKLPTLRKWSLLNLHTLWKKPLLSLSVRPFQKDSATSIQFLKLAVVNKNPGKWFENQTYNHTNCNYIFEA